MKQKKEKQKEKSGKLKKAVALSQVFSMILEVFAFAFIFGGMAVLSSESVSAVEYSINNVPPNVLDAMGTETYRLAIKSGFTYINYDPSYKTVLYYSKDSDGKILHLMEYNTDLRDFLPATSANLKDSVPMPGRDGAVVGDSTYYSSDPGNLEGYGGEWKGPGWYWDNGHGEVVKINDPANPPLGAGAETPTGAPSPTASRGGPEVKVVELQSKTTGVNETFKFAGMGGWGANSNDYVMWTGSHMVEGLSWAGAMWTFMQGISSMLPEKQQKFMKPLGQALSLSIMTYKTIYGAMTATPGGGGSVGDWMHSKLPDSVCASGAGCASGASFVAAAVVFYLYMANNYKKEKETERTIQFKCMAWQAPRGGSSCDRCNGDPLRPCSEYRCRALGQTCKLINQGTGFEKCIDSAPNDVTSPGIKPWNFVLTNGYKYDGVKPRPPGKSTGGTSGMKIRSMDGGCLKAFTPFEFGIVTTDDVDGKEATQPAQCKLDFNHTKNFDQMAYYMGENNLFVENHSQAFSLPGTDLLNKLYSDTNTSLPIQNNGEYNLYIRCRDGNGNENEDEFAVSFCIEKTPDLNVPEIKETNIPSGSPVLYKIDNVSIDVYTNEPANCRWSRRDADYLAMENNMTCTSNVWEMNAQMLYPCSTTLTGIEDEKENKFYFRCVDLSNNTMKQSYPFTLIGTKSLTLRSVGPNGTVGSPTTTAIINLTARTDNGFRNGEATCYYSTTGEDRDYIEMFDTGQKSSHLQTLDLLGGSYTYYIKCIDAGGNTDSKTTNFTVFVDKFEPQIVRAYSYEGKLVVTTDEDSTCRYSTDSCNFDMDSEGITEMPYLASKNHYAGWVVEQNYYVKCSDKYGNQPLPDECSMIIRPYQLPAKE